MTREGEISAFQSLATNAFIEREQIRKVSDLLHPRMFGGGKIRKKPYEADAVAAVAAVMFADGNLSDLSLVFDTRRLTEKELNILASASQRLLRNPKFTRELFNGDARDMIDAAIEKGRERFGR